MHGVHTVILVSPEATIPHRRRCEGVRAVTDRCGAR